MAEKNILLKAFNARWASLRKELSRARRKQSEDVVHDLRVASRRLIAVLETLREIQDGLAVQDFRRRVKKLLDGLSPLRDLHVQRMHVSKLAAQSPQLKGFEKSLADKENQTAGKVKRILKHSPKLGRAMTQSSRHARKAVDRRAILKVIDKRFRKVLLLAGRIEPSDTSTIHQMRLAFKKFRYTCEVAQPIIRKEMDDARLEQFHAFQTMMGDIQDIEVLSGRLSRWTEKRKCKAEMEPVFKELEVEKKKRIDTFVRSAEQVHTLWNPGARK